MDGAARTLNSPDGRSLKDMLALIGQGGMSLVDACLPPLSDLGEKGDLRFYLKDLGPGGIRFEICQPNELFPAGAKEMTWEQACEVLIRLKVQSEYDQKLGELEEQKWELVGRYQELIQKQQQLAKEVGCWNHMQAGRARSQARSRRRSIFWAVVGAESVAASRAFGRWIKSGS